MLRWQRDALWFPPGIKELMVCGGNGCGKTDFIAQFLMTRMAVRPGSHGFLASASFPLLARSTALKFFDWLARHGFREGRDFTYHKQDKRVYFPATGCTLFLLSLHVPRSQLEGFEASFGALDEIAASDPTKIPSLLSRLREPGGLHEMLFAGYPPAYGGWLHERFTGEYAPPTCRMVTVPTHVNLRSHGGFLVDSYLERLESVYHPGTPRHKRMVLGEFAALEGLVYQEFDPRKHVVSAYPSPVRRYLYGMDLGYNPNPLVFLRAAVCDGDVLVVDHEHYHSGWLYADHAAAIVPHLMGGSIACDHDAQGRAELAALGLPVTAAHKSVNLGIDSVRRRLADGRLLFLRGRAPNTIREFGQYAYPPERAGADVKGEQVPLKKHDHAMDALRYLVAEEEWRGHGQFELAPVPADYVDSVAARLYGG